jgi:hypothetical protein
MFSGQHSRFGSLLARRVAEGHRRNDEILKMVYTYRKKVIETPDDV